jgi:hypothetical protein
MRQIDMSAEAVTARLKLVSELRRLCLALGTAKIKPHNARTKDKERRDGKKVRQPPRQ